MAPWPRRSVLGLGNLIPIKGPRSMGLLRPHKGGAERGAGRVPAASQTSKQEASPPRHRWQTGREPGGPSACPKQLDARAGACGCADPASDKPRGGRHLRGEADGHGELPAHLRELRPPALPRGPPPPVAFLSICGHFILVNTLFFLRRKYWCQFHPQLKDKSEPCPAQGPEGKHHRRETDIDFFAWRQKNKCVILNLHCK